MCACVCVCSIGLFGGLFVLVSWSSCLILRHTGKSAWNTDDIDAADDTYVTAGTKCHSRLLFETQFLGIIWFEMRNYLLT